MVITNILNPCALEESSLSIGRVDTQCAFQVLYGATVPTFNSCTKCVGSPGRIHDRTPDCPPIFLGMDVYMTSQSILALIRKLRVSPICLAY